MRALGIFLLWLVTTTREPARPRASLQATPPTIVSWQWDFGDPSTGILNHSTEQNPMHQFAHAKQYVVTLTVTDSNGQTATTKRYVTVTK